MIFGMQSILMEKFRDPIAIAKNCNCASPDLMRQLVKINTDGIGNRYYLNEIRHYFYSGPNQYEYFIKGKQIKDSLNAIPDNSESCKPYKQFLKEQEEGRLIERDYADGKIALGAVGLPLCSIIGYKTISRLPVTFGTGLIALICLTGAIESGSFLNEGVKLRQAI